MTRRYKFKKHPKHITFETESANDLNYVEIAVANSLVDPNFVISEGFCVYKHGDLKGLPLESPRKYKISKELRKHWKEVKK